MSLALVLLSSAVGTVARAQSCPGGGDTARELFEHASMAMEAEQWVNARDCLRQARTLLANVSICGSLVIALRKTDDPLAALRLIEDMENGECGPLDAEERGRVEEQRVETEQALSYLRVRVFGAPGVRLFVAGAEVATTVSTEEHRVPVNAGRYIVEARHPTGASARRQVRVQPRAETRLNLTVDLQEEDEPSSGIGVGWFVLGGGLVAAAITVVVVLIATSGSEPEFDGEFPALRGP
ncbi:MAG: hypothetical protein AAGF12_07600 [Myxococcota bacterium]